MLENAEESKNVDISRNWELWLAVEGMVMGWCVKHYGPDLGLDICQDAALKFVEKNILDNTKANRVFAIDKAKEVARDDYGIGERPKKNKAVMVSFDEVNERELHRALKKNLGENAFAEKIQPFLDHPDVDPLVKTAIIRVMEGEKLKDIAESFNLPANTLSVIVSTAAKKVSECQGILPFLSKVKEKVVKRVFLPSPEKMSPNSDQLGLF